MHGSPCLIRFCGDFCDELRLGRLCGLFCFSYTSKEKKKRKDYGGKKGSISEYCGMHKIVIEGLKGK